MVDFLVLILVSCLICFENLPRMMELLPYEVEIPCVEKLLHDLVGLGGNELSYVPMVSTMLKVLLKQLPIYSHYQ